MPVLLYTLGIHCYRLLIRIASVFHTKARLRWKGEQNIWEDLRPLQEQKSPVIWFHCASLGEFEQAKPLIQLFKKEQHHYPILVTFFSPSGMVKATGFAEADVCTYLPFDTPSNARRLFHTIRPLCCIVIKYDLWYHHFNTASQQAIPLFLVSAVFRNGGRMGWAAQKMTIKTLSLFDIIFCQDEASLHKIAHLGLPDVRHTGDTRIDRVLDISQTPYNPEFIHRFTGHSRVLIAGSSWEIEENLIIKALPTLLQEGFKLIIAPHDIRRTPDILSAYRSFKPLLFSHLRMNDYPSGTVMIVDTIGDLSFLYRFADVAFIGGGFTNKLHNIYEAAVYQKPVVFGHRHSRFAEAQIFLQHGFAVAISDHKDLINACLQMPATYPKQKSEDFFGSQKGVSRSIYAAIKQKLPSLP
jgi:3-deoxy-D-manno-octulosonic-acid transferase